jgi:hypothetical protein
MKGSASKEAEFCEPKLLVGVMVLLSKSGKLPALSSTASTVSLSAFHDLPKKPEEEIEACLRQIELSLTIPKAATEIPGNAGLQSAAPRNQIPQFLRAKMKKQILTTLSEHGKQLLQDIEAIHATKVICISFFFFLL